MAKQQVKAAPRPGLREVAKNAHQIPTKRQFAAKYPSARYSGKSRKWVMNETDYVRYLKNPVKSESWVVECDGIAI